MNSGYLTIHLRDLTPPAGWLLDGIRIHPPGSYKEERFFLDQFTDNMFPGIEKIFSKIRNQNDKDIIIKRLIEKLNKVNEERTSL